MLPQSWQGRLGIPRFIDFDGSSPLRKSCTLCISKRTTLVKPIQTRAPLLTFCASEGFETSVYLDTRYNSLSSQDFDHGLSGGRVLVKSFFKQNCTRNIVTKTLGREKEVTPLSTVWFDIFNSD